MMNRRLVFFQTHRLRLRYLAQLQLLAPLDMRVWAIKILTFRFDSCCVGWWPVPEVEIS